MNKSQFTDEQLNNLTHSKGSLNSEDARGGAEKQDKAESVTSAILNDPNFKNGENLTTDSQDSLHNRAARQEGISPGGAVQRIAGTIAHAPASPDFVSVLVRCSQR